MYIIKNKTGKSFLVWDSGNEKLLNFENGEYKTNDKDQANRLKEVGFDVEVKTSAKKKTD